MPSLWIWNKQPYGVAHREHTGTGYPGMLEPMGMGNLWTGIFGYRGSLILILTVAIHTYHMATQKIVLVPLTVAVPGSPEQQTCLQGSKQVLRYLKRYPAAKVPLYLGLWSIMGNNVILQSQERGNKWKQLILILFKSYPRQKGVS